MVGHLAQNPSYGGEENVSNSALKGLKKGTRDIKDFLKSDKAKLDKILKQAKRPMADTAAVNATRFALLNILKATGLPVETGSGGLTKFNRTSQKIDKSHWTDAACVGLSTPKLNIKGVKPLIVKAMGHGTRQSCRTDKFGFPTGDIVKAVVTTGKKVGVYVGRIATRATGSFNISTKSELVQGVSYKYCRAVHKKDGYSYAN